MPVFDIHSDNSLRLAMQKMTATHAHRLWVTDRQGVVEGVVSLTDILRLLAQDANKRMAAPDEM